MLLKNFQHDETHKTKTRRKNDATLLLKRSVDERMHSKPSGLTWPFQKYGAPSVMMYVADKHLTTRANKTKQDRPYSRPRDNPSPVLPSTLREAKTRSLEAFSKDNWTLLTQMQVQRKRYDSNSKTLIPREAAPFKAAGHSKHKNV